MHIAYSPTADEVLLSSRDMTIHRWRLRGQEVIKAGILGNHATLTFQHADLTGIKGVSPSQKTTIKRAH